MRKTLVLLPENTNDFYARWGKRFECWVKYNSAMRHIMAKSAALWALLAMDCGSNNSDRRDLLDNWQGSSVLIDQPIMILQSRSLAGH